MKPDRKRKLVDAVRGEWQVSIRRACAALEFDRSTYHYKHRRPEQASLRKRIRELSEARVRYGYRRIHVLLRREGPPRLNADPALAHHDGIGAPAAALGQQNRGPLSARAARAARGWAILQASQ